MLDLESQGPGSIPPGGKYHFLLYNPNLHNIVRSGRIRFKMKNPNELIKKTNCTGISPTLLGMIEVKIHNEGNINQVKFKFNENNHSQCFYLTRDNKLTKLDIFANLISIGKEIITLKYVPDRRSSNDNVKDKDLGGMFY